MDAKKPEAKKPSRRKFLTAGAAAAAVGAMQTASGQAPAPAAQPQKTLKELVAYGERFVSSPPSACPWWKDLPPMRLALCFMC